MSEWGFIATVLLSCLTSLAVTTSLFAIRNHWVLRQRKRWYERMREYNCRRIAAGKESEIEAINALWSYDKMVHHFWIWDVERMVENRAVYERIVRDEAERKEVLH